MFRVSASLPCRRPSGARRAIVAIAGACLGVAAVFADGVVVVRAADLTLTCAQFTPQEGNASSVGVVANLIDANGGDTASNFTATVVGWGDGTSPPQTAVVTGGGSSFTISDTHAYAEEGRYTFSLSVTDSDLTSTPSPATCSTTVIVGDAPLGPPPTTAPSSFTGAGSAAATSSLNAFEAGIGGVKNTTPKQQSGGFRVINWDGVKTDGTDSVAGPNSTTVIDAGKTVGIPTNRFRGSGVDFGSITAVSNQGFADINANVATLFPAFSTPNTFAPFNTSVVAINFVTPTPPNTMTATQGTAGFGAIFLDVSTPNTTSIEYFSGTTSLGRFFAPVGAAGAPSFLGELFAQPVVTRVVINLGTAQIFSFDGTTATGNAATQPTVDYVAMDDMVFAEPAPVAPVQTISAGTPFNATAASFTDSDPNGNANDFTALIHWDDGSVGSGTVAAGTSGQFLVNGTHNFNAGTFNVRADVSDYGGAFASVRSTVVATAESTTTSLSTSTASTNTGQPVMLTALVSPQSGTIPVSGTVTFSDSNTVIGSAQLPGSASGPATATLTTSTLTAGTHSITASYVGDGRYLPSPSNAVAVTISPFHQGFWMVASDGGIFPLGDAVGYGSTGGMHLNRPIVGMAVTVSGNGYWLVASDGGIFPFGDALQHSYGSTGGIHLNQPIVGMASTASGNGYWLVASDGGIFPFGDATQHSYGSTGGIHLNQPILGMAATASGNGYWLVASDGGIFPFGDALEHSYGSTGGIHLNHPIVGMTPTRDGGGYWLVASDGGIFPFGDAVGYGSTGALTLNNPIIGMASTRDGGGYWLVAADGGVFPFGNAPSVGSLGGTPLNQPIVGVTPSHRPS